MSKLKESDTEDEQLSLFQKLKLLPRKTLLASFTFLLFGTIILGAKKKKFKI